MGVLDAAVSCVHLDSYKFVKAIENGALGSAALYEDNEGNEVFVKIIKRSALNLAKEDAIALHSTVMSPNVVAQREVVVRRDGVVRIVMDYCTGGTLEAHVKNSPGSRLTESEARSLFQQLMKAVEYTERMGVSARDLKMTNTLLQATGTDGSSGAPLQLKVSDFGYGIHDSTDMRRRAAALAYVPPEVMDSDEYDDELKDVWQCGVMLYAMLYGRLPFSAGPHLSKLDSEQMAELHAHEASDGIVLPDDITLSAEVSDLLYRMLAPVPGDRAKVADVMAHPWFVQDLPQEAEAVPVSAAEEAAPSMKKRQSVQDIKQLLDYAQESAI